jgi:hypothetical protein
MAQQRYTISVRKLPPPITAQAMIGANGINKRNTGMPYDMSPVDAPGSLYNPGPNDNIPDE